MSGMLREGGRPLVALLLLALLLKLVVALTAASSDPATAFPASDARYYLDRALGLKGLLNDPLASEAHHLPPLYPRLLSLLPSLDAASQLSARLAQAIAGTVTLVLCFLLARRRLSRQAALIAVALTFGYAPLTFYETQLLGDSLATLLLLGAAVAADGLAAGVSAATATRKPGAAALKHSAATWPRAALLGACLSLAALLRPQALLLLPALALWVAWQCRACRPAGLALGAYLLAALLPLLPSTLHNARASGDFLPVSDNGGVNFWLANTGPLSGTFMTDRAEFGDIARQAAVARALAEETERQRAGAAARTPLSAGEVSSWFASEAWSVIRAQPLRFAERLLLRARALGESYEADVACFPTVQMHRLPPLLPLALPFGVLAGLALGARLLGARLRPAPTAPAWALAGMIGLTALLFFHYSRFRLPLVPWLAILAASSWDRLRLGQVGLGRGLVAATAVLGVTAISVWPAPHHEPLRAAGFATAGWARLALLTPGDRPGAQAALQEGQAAVAIEERSPRAQLLVARAAFLLDDFETCATALDTLLRLSPDQPAGLLSRAWLLARRDPRNRHYDEAAARALVARLRTEAGHDAQVQAGLHAIEAALLPPR